MAGMSKLMLCFCFWAVLAVAAAGQGKPNVLLIAVDDLKPVLGCYGDRVARTPSIDKLAKRGRVFQMAYCNQAVCAPSRNNLMTGSLSTTLGIYNLSTNFRKAVPDAVTLTQLFMTNGWRAEGIGKIFHVGHGNHGDEASWSVPFQPEKVIAYADPKSSAGGQLTREEALFANEHLGNISSLPRGAAWEAAEVEDNAYPDGRIAEEGIRRLRARAKEPGQPFFLALGFVKPHLPLCAPKKYWDLYDRNKFKLARFQRPPEGAPHYAGKTLLELNQYEPIPERGPLSNDLQRTLIHAYYASVSYMDAQVGRVLDELDRLGLGSNTIVLLWGDHGWHLGDHGSWTKHTNYEQANRIPLIIAAPGVTKGGGRTMQPAGTVDIYPTLAELAGLRTDGLPQKLDGVSLVPVLRDPSARVREFTTHVFPRQRGREHVLGRAVRTGRYRLIEWKPAGGPESSADIELYDYKADPDERKNLAGVRPDVVRSLRKILAGMPEARRPL